MEALGGQDHPNVIACSPQGTGLCLQAWAALVVLPPRGRTQVQVTSGMMHTSKCAQQLPCGELCLVLACIQPSWSVSAHALWQSKMMAAAGGQRWSAPSCQFPVIARQRMPHLILLVVCSQAAADTALRLSTVTLLAYQCHRGAQAKAGLQAKDETQVKHWTLQHEAWQLGA